MPKATLIFVVSVVTLLAGCDRATSKAASGGAPREVRIEKAAFGLFERDGEKVTFSPTKTVPFSVGQGYGWVVKLDTKKETVRWREEFTLPAAPIHWDGDSLPGSSQQVSADGRTSTLERDVALNNGVVLNAWSVAEGDPRGRYTIRLFVADAEPVVFEFDVQ
ncbi:hypothetical protein ACWKW4_20900 [Hydrogenophaga borbori]